MAMDKSILAINDRLDRIEAKLDQLLASKPAVDVTKAVKDAVTAALREMASEPKTTGGAQITPPLPQKPSTAPPAQPQTGQPTAVKDKK